jgi:outer membrane protein OmpA-like peptidoglycan-associated protein
MPRWVSVGVVALSILGCATAPTTGPAAPAAAAPRRVATLDAERQWLQSWFSGTPVLIEYREGGPLSIDVPLEFSFDTGRSSVKRPLAVVLDKVAESLRRNPPVRLERVAAPADGAAGSALAQQRATQVRKHLLARGVPAAQLGNPTVTTAAAVQLRMDLASP